MVRQVRDDDDSAEARTAARNRRLTLRRARPWHRCASPSKLPWINDCISGSSEAPAPPTIAQKAMIAAGLWENRRDRSSR
jgi:hypothetical protein